MIIVCIVDNHKGGVLIMIPVTLLPVTLLPANYNLNGYLMLDKLLLYSCVFSQFLNFHKKYQMFSDIILFWWPRIDFSAQRSDWQSCLQNSRICFSLLLFDIPWSNMRSTSLQAICHYTLLFQFENTPEARDPRTFSTSTGAGLARVAKWRSPPGPHCNFEKFSKWPHPFKAWQRPTGPFRAMTPPQRKKYQSAPLPQFQVIFCRPYVAWKNQLYEQ